MIHMVSHICLQQPRGKRVMMIQQEPTYPDSDKLFKSVLARLEFEEYLAS